MRAPRASGALPADTLRGIVMRVGPLAGATLELRSPGRPGVVLTGADSAALAAADGVEIVVTGRHPPGDRRFMVEAFAVHAVDGVPAVDGILLLGRDGFALRRADGTVTALPLAPSTLAPLAGARIYWAGPLDRPPVAYGVLTPP